MTVPTKDILSADHEELGQLLNNIFVFLEQADAPNSLAVLDLFWARLAMHIRAEHLHLFPALLPSASNPVANIIGQLRIDHNWFMEELASLIKETRPFANTENSGAWPKPIAAKERLETLRDRLTAHDELEETDIYPLVEQFLSPEEVITLNVCIEKELKKLPPRFSDRGNFSI